MSDQEPVLDAHEPATNRNGAAWLYDKRGERCGVWFPDLGTGIIGGTHVKAIEKRKD